MAAGNCSVGLCTRTLQDAPYGPPSAEGGGAHMSSRLLNTSGKRSVEGVRAHKIGWMGMSFLGHYPPPCVALVKLGETLTNLAWHFVSILCRISRVRTHARRGTEVLTYAMQALQDQDVAMGSDAPHARLCREVHSRANEVRSTALTIHDITQQTMRAGQYGTCWQASNACWDIVNEMCPGFAPIRGREQTTSQLTRSAKWLPTGPCKMMSSLSPCSFLFQGLLG